MKLAPLFCLAGILFATGIFSQNSSFDPLEQYDQFGRIVKKGDETFNFPSEDISHALPYNPSSSNSQALPVQVVMSDEVDCDIVWGDAIFGTCIGRNNSLIPFDYNDDGHLDLIANASSRGFGDEGFWYILSFNESTENYEKIYASPLYEEDIEKMALADIDNSGKDELIFVIESTMYVVDLTTYDVIGSADYSSYFSPWSDITQIRFTDINNDSENEIVLGSDDELVIINPTNLEAISAHDISSRDFAVGNVDDDPANEVVFMHGEVWELNGDDLLTEYDFLPGSTSAYGAIELTDTDGDGRLEAIIGYNNITIYDVEIESPKFEIDLTFSSVAALILRDINGDGVEEIITGASQWGEIQCFDSTTGEEIWWIDNPEHGTTGIAIEDFDQDGASEIVWGAGCSSTGADYLFFHSVTNLQLEWQSQHLGGPFYALEIADTDGDGENELISVSFDSGSGYDSGILTVYDAQSKEIEFRSDGNFFESVWTGIYTVEVVDYGNDLDMDIVVAAGQIYDGKIWVIDGDTYTIEAEFEYDDAPQLAAAFYALKTTDIDGDNTDEFIVASSQKLHIINSETFEIEWSSVSLQQFGEPNGLLTGNIDDDPEEEIVLCFNFIYTYDNGTYTQSQSDEGHYTSAQLFDWDGDGILEIIAGTTGGAIVILDGQTLEVEETIFDDFGAIGAIAFADLDFDGEEEIITTLDGHVLYLKRDGQSVFSQRIAGELGEHDGLIVQDFDNDGIPNIILGSKYNIVELDPACAQCLSFEFSVASLQPTCGEANGSILVNSPDPLTSFTYQSVAIDSILSGLDEGVFNITATNAFGCIETTTLALEQQLLEISTTSNDLSCFGVPDGSATVSVQQGLPPYEYLWENGSTTETIEGLPLGLINVSVTDENGCLQVASLDIGQSELISVVDVQAPACIGQMNGVAAVNIIDGIAPYEYVWDGVPGNVVQSGFDTGTYQVVVTDAIGCTSEHEFLVDSDSIVIQSTVVSHSCNDENDGLASVGVIFGTPPFYFSWSNGVTGSQNTFNLPPGEYQVTVSDGNGCIASNSLTIEAAVLVAEISHEDNDCFGEMNGSASATVTEGVPPFGYQWDSGQTFADIFSLGTGSYSVLINDVMGCSTIETVEITSPDEIIIELNTMGDDQTNPSPDGSIEAIVTGGVEPYFFNWDNGETTSSISDLVSGTYTLTVTDGNFCTNIATATVETVTSVAEVSAEKFTLFPNPSSGRVYISSQAKNHLLRKVSVVHGQGNHLLTQMVTSPDFTLDLSTFPSGLYMVVIENEHGKKWLKKVAITP